MTAPPGQPVLCLVAALRDVEPPVWRRILVPGSVRLDKLHRMIQAAMGWEDRHLHCFEIAGTRYGQLFDEHPLDEVDEKSVTVITAIGAVERFTYEYDFGDCWEHDVTIEAVQRLPVGLKLAVCIDGANACPPEDCGGTGGYEDLRAVIADPGHEDHADLIDWLGGPLDPTAFDLALTNAQLQKLR